MPFLLLFLVWPLLEIFAFMAVGDEIGVLNTLLLAIGMMIAGGVLIQIQGLKSLSTIQSALSRGALPVPALFDQVCLFLAGGLFLLPGFLSDVIGIALLIPPLRQGLRHVVSRFFTGKPMDIRGFGRETSREESIDVEFVVMEEEDPDDDDRDRPLLP